MTNIINQDQWVNDLKEVIARAFSYTVIGVACFGAAASSFLAIPGLLNLISLELSSYILNAIYGVAVINGVTYTVSQFWDSLLENTRVNLLGLAPIHKQEMEKENLNVTEKIDEIIEEINAEISILGEIDLNSENILRLKSILTRTRHHIQLNNSRYEQLEHTNVEDENLNNEETNLVYSIFFNLLYCASSIFAGIVISSGMLTAFILTILGTTRAIDTLAPMFLGPAALSGITVTAIACVVAVGNQYCKSSTFGHKQWKLLMSFSPFSSEEYSEEEHLPPKDVYLKLQVILSEIKEIHQKTEIQNLQNEIRRLQA